MLQFLSQKLGYGITHIAASVLYSTIEGIAFLFRPYGIAAILGSEIVVSTVQNPRRVGRIFANSLAYIDAGRMCLSYVALLRQNRRRHQDDVLKSIWDWKPPEEDVMGSNTWFVLKELVFTLQKLKEEYPEIEQYLSRSEFSPMEMAPRLYYYLKKQDRVGQDDLTEDDMHRELESDEDTQGLLALQQYKDSRKPCSRPSSKSRRDAVFLRRRTTRLGRRAPSRREAASRCSGSSPATKITPWPAPCSTTSARW